MLLTWEYMKMLHTDGDEKFRAREGLNSAQKKELLDFDAEYYEFHGEHIITNYQDLE